MFKRILVVGILVILSVSMAATVLADIPQLISFQGKLYDDGGNPLNGEYALTFRIYDVETGGTSLWSEVIIVECEDGLYNATLDTINEGDTVTFSYKNGDSCYGEYDSVDVSDCNEGLVSTNIANLVSGDYYFIKCEAWNDAGTTLLWRSPFFWSESFHAHT